MPGSRQVSSHSAFEKVDFLEKLERHKQCEIRKASKSPAPPLRSQHRHSSGLEQRPRRHSLPPGASLVPPAGGQVFHQASLGSRVLVKTQSRSLLAEDLRDTASVRKKMRHSAHTGSEGQFPVKFPAGVQAMPRRHSVTGNAIADAFAAISGDSAERSSSSSGGARTGSKPKVMWASDTVDAVVWGTPPKQTGTGSRSLAPPLHEQLVRAITPQGPSRAASPAPVLIEQGTPSKFVNGLRDMVKSASTPGLRERIPRQMSVSTAEPSGSHSPRESRSTQSRSPRDAEAEASPVQPEAEQEGSSESVDNTSKEGVAGEGGDDSREQDAGKPVCDDEGTSYALLVRDAFKRFRSKMSGELNVEEIGNTLLLLGYWGACEDDEIARIAKEVTEYDSLNAEQTIEFMEKWTLFMEQWLQQRFTEFLLEKEAEKLLAKDMPDLLRAVGVVAVAQVIEEIMKTCGLADKEELDFSDFARFCQQYQQCQGFTAKEIDEAYQTLDEAKNEELPANIQPAVRIKNLELMSTALQVYDLWAVEQAKEIFLPLEAAEDDTCAFQSGAVQFPEFLAWCRLLRDAFMSQLWEEFANHTEDHSVGLQREDLPETMLQLGYSLQPEALDEFLESAEVSCPMTFDSFVFFAMNCFESDGFTETEAAEFNEVFDRFDYEKNGEIGAVGVIDMIHFLGHHTSADKAQKLMLKVDFNGNGTMDVGEFMRLMRLHREDTMTSVRDVFFAENVITADGVRKVPLEVVPNALVALGEEAPGKNFMEDLTGKYDDEGLTLKEFTDVADAHRKEAVENKRKYAGFSEQECKAVEELFFKYCCDDNKHIDLGGLLYMLEEIKVETSTPGTRKRIIDWLPKARKSACDAGVDPEEMSNFDDKSCYHDVLHLLRLIVRENELEALAREEAAVAETKFTTPEVEEFRTIFFDWYKHGVVVHTGDRLNKRLASKRQVRRRRNALERMQTQENILEEGVDGEDNIDTPTGGRKKAGVDLVAVVSMRPRMEVAGLKDLLASIGVKLKPDDREKLERRAKMGDDPENIGIDFPSFLRLFHWMIDTDFANINTVSARVSHQAKA
eukprot:TRINITY_DN47104_c0_g1_i2.p1 TRINITY_DN47104_c0_g1~~TRINITY_DN47104_c0_g1_i2.p1  ORF type:complete len:1071 (-),score=282.57 TRINITY_DN47104_c0_g1_i2:444-3656(-)